MVVFSQLKSVILLLILLLLPISGWTDEPPKAAVPTQENPPQVTPPPEPPKEAEKPHTRWFNLQLNTQMGYMLEIPYKNFGIAFDTQTAWASSSGFGSSMITMQTDGIRISHYSQGMGQDSFYFGIDGGIFSINGSYTPFMSSTLYSGNSSGSYFGGALGYHWFWKYFNLKLGLVYESASMKSLSLYSSSGALGQTVNVPAYTGAGGELALGIAF